jgi:hypothetical protein
MDMCFLQPSCPLRVILDGAFDSAKLLWKNRSSLKVEDAGVAVLLDNAKLDAASWSPRPPGEYPASAYCSPHRSRRQERQEIY